MKASLVLLALVSVGLGCAVAPAPDTPPTPPHVDRTLSTSAEAEIKVTPDQAVLTFTVSAHAGNAGKALAAVDAPTARVLVAAKARGVKPEHLQSAQVTLQPQFLFDKKGRSSPNGVMGTRTISVMLSDLTKLDLVVQDVLATSSEAKGAATVTLANMRFDDSKLTEHKALARVHAAEAARKKAQSLAETLGAKLGPPRLVTEGSEPMLRGYEQWQNVSYNFAKDLSSEGGGVVTSTFAPGQVVVSAGVQVVFDLQT